MLVSGAPREGDEWWWLASGDVASEAMPSRFETDTAVERVGDGRFRARIDGGWWIVRGPNGGYIAAIVVNALTAALADPARTPRSLTIHYLRPPVEGPVELEVTIERAGRSLTNASVRMTQGDELVVLALAACSTDRSAFEHVDVAMPDVRPVDELPDLPAPPVEIPMRARYETRWAIGTPPVEGQTREGRAEVGGWIRLAEPAPVDHAVVAAFTDAWIPAVFTWVPPGQGVPTVDLTVHFRDAPPAAHEWCFVRFRTRVLTRGFLEEDGEVWSADGRLLAQSRQLGVLLT